MGVRLLDILGSSEAKIAAGAIALIGVAMFVSVSVKDTTQAASSTTKTTTSDFETRMGKPDPGFHPGDASNYADNLARTSGGDWNKLSRDDQRYVNSLTAGHGQNYIRDRARALLQDEKKKKKATGEKSL